MQAQIFPRGTYAPTMGVFALAQGGPTNGMANELQSLFLAPTSAPITPSPKQQSKSSSAMPRFTAAHYQASMRAASPPVSQSSCNSSDSGNSSGTEESSAEEDASEVSCNPTVSGKLSRALKNLRRIGGGGSKQ